MINRFLLIFGIFLLTISISKAQNHCPICSMKEKIDSISKNDKIDMVQVKINLVTNSFNKTATDQFDIAQSEGLKFDGQFLVVGNKFFNLNKLLYFEIEKKKKNKIIFYFQAY
jgi:hypothetical protein